MTVVSRLQYLHVRTVQCTCIYCMVTVSMVADNLMHLASVEGTMDAEGKIVFFANLHVLSHILNTAVTGLMQTTVVHVCVLWMHEVFSRVV